MQSDALVQLTPVPPKPTCNPNYIFDNGACADKIRAYNQAVAQRQQEEMQLYVNRQKQLASEKAAAPLQQQISALNKLIAGQQLQMQNLQSQAQAQAMAASQSAVAARRVGLEQGVGIGVTTTLVFFGIIYGLKRMSRNFTIVKKEHARVASA